MPTFRGYLILVESNNWNSYSQLGPEMNKTNMVQGMYIASWGEECTE